MSAKNKEIVEKVNASFAEGGLEGFLSYCADDVDLDHRRRQDWLKEKRPFANGWHSMDMEPPKFTVEKHHRRRRPCHRAWRNDHEGQRWKDGSYEYCDIYRFRDGKIAELRSFVVKTEAKAETASGA